MKNTWQQVMDLKSADTRKRGVANTLVDDEIETILAVMDFFGASSNELRNVLFDLKAARYRVFDWLAMGIGGRIEARQAVQVLAYSFIKSEGNVDKFINDLRVSDYDIDHRWEDVEV